MSSVIKATHNSNRVIQQVAFNLEDLTQQAQQYLEQVRLQAAQIVVEAQKQADLVKKKAEDERSQHGTCRSRENPRRKSRQTDGHVAASLATSLSRSERCQTGLVYDTGNKLPYKSRRAWPKKLSAAN